MKITEGIEQIEYSEIIGGNIIFLSRNNDYVPTRRGQITKLGWYIQYREHNDVVMVSV